MNTTAIIVAAGKGKRLSSKNPKQYIKIAGRAILDYTLANFNSHQLIDEIVLVVSRNKINDTKKIVTRYGKVSKVVAGGSNRAQSVYNGLQAVPDDTKIVLVHDGVRPLVNPALIRKMITAAARYGAAVPAVAPKATIKEVSRNGWITKTLSRTTLAEIQTPQAFKRTLLLNCYQKYKHKLKDITDDSSLVESAGHKVKKVAGNYNNIKITTKDDLEIFKLLTGFSQNHLRVGLGYDIHPLVKKRPLVLGGVKIPVSLGLAGHSDADVLLHAISDAIFGAVSKRDLGWHFSDKDQKYKNKESKYFLLQALQKIKEIGCRIQNVDSTVIAQYPRLQPYYGQMVKNISHWLKLPQNRVTVKFCSPEEVGPLGAKKARAALAVVTISY